MSRTEQVWKPELIPCRWYEQFKTFRQLHIGYYINWPANTIHEPGVHVRAREDAQ